MDTAGDLVLAHNLWTHRGVRGHRVDVLRPKFRWLFPKVVLRRILTVQMQLLVVGLLVLYLCLFNLESEPAQISLNLLGFVRICSHTIVGGWVFASARVT